MATIENRPLRPAIQVPRARASTPYDGKISFDFSQRSQRVTLHDENAEEE